jgi:DNA-binding FadR family transcriptional regulator
MTRRVATAAAKPASDPEALVDELAIKIQSRILAGEYVGEEWLRQEALATEFGVSRTPVREALRKLEASGFLTLVPHRGAQARILWVNDNPGGNLSSDPPSRSPSRAPIAARTASRSLSSSSTSGRSCGRRRRPGSTSPGRGQSGSRWTAI